ncbi:hypothetical protein [uncultured Clostridium sp.]|uniref:hypothetical protein n=1 Tax=uncultured Clostridium sp. TaxID=59620 RepID=UPI002603235A|nr:hypothetical protein [uncultured Clostridium sp.]
MRFLKENELEESNRYRRLKRALFGDPSGKIRTFAIISPENPVGIFGQEEWDKIKQAEKSDFNKQNSKELKQKLSKVKAIRDDGDKAIGYGGYDYIKIKGKYGASEQSYLILNLTLEDAKCIARCYGQESFFFAKVSKNPNIEPSAIAYYKTTNQCRSYRLVEITRTISDESDAEDFFSKYGIKFRINMQEFGDAVTPIKNNGMFEESFTRPTYMLRGSARRSARQEIEE